ncbi:ObirOr5-9E66 [Ooceraea biroi]|uniref:Odorant receptor n=1 Tax=Ooceraea biroi TaxID=2015173 RepID=A0A3L8E0P3_OOCBI|nr:odorant receptor 13a [Ooceraea biroi]RLU26063.1 ObirOr5-9E66 [Ooceraea biroi]
MDTQFLYIHRLSMVAIGLWPYHRTMLVQLQCSVFSLTVISFIIFQLTTFLTTEWTIEFIVEILSTSLIFLLCATVYNSFWSNTHVVKRVLKNLQYICSDLKDENEIAILKRYGYIAKCATIGMTLFVMCISFIGILLPILPRIFGIFFLVNESEPYRITYIKTEYFVDEATYFYFILLHLYAVYYIAGGTTLVAGIIVAGYFTYCCGLFNIASYRIEQAMRIKSDDVTNPTNKRQVDKKISHAVDIHRTTLKILEFYLYNFEETSFLIIVLIVICLSLHLFGILHTVCFAFRIEEFLLHFGCAIGFLGFSFAGNYVGEAITDHYNYIFSTAYNGQWYVAPVRVQRLILFLLQRGTKSYGLTFGCLYTLSLESFASLSTTSISYVTVIYSIQK